MRLAYAKAQSEIQRHTRKGEKILDCGAGSGGMFTAAGVSTADYVGIEWQDQVAQKGRDKGLDIATGDLNQPIGFDNEYFTTIFGLSVLEHLLTPCAYLRECYRVLKPDGTLVLLTPNISTYFTAALILMGRMPSSGPHPDSNALLQREEPLKVSAPWMQHDAEGDSPTHRHLVVFSFRVLRDYLTMLGFRSVAGYGFGLYPFPAFMQPLLERIDPYHCHQMVFVARK